MGARGGSLQLYHTYAALSDAGKVDFLALLAHALTVSARASYPGQVGDAEAAPRLVAFNELQHAVTGQLLKMMAGDERRHPDDAFIEIISECGKREGCEADFGWAVAFALEHLRGR